jgi:hypothetical protein
MFWLLEPVQLVWRIPEEELVDLEMDLVAQTHRVVPVLLSCGTRLKV